MNAQAITTVLRHAWRGVRPTLRDDERMEIVTHDLVASDFDGYRIRADYFRVDRHGNMVSPSYRHAVVNVLGEDLARHRHDRGAIIDVLRLALQKLAVLLTPRVKPPVGWRLYSRCRR